MKLFKKVLMLTLVLVAVLVTAGCKPDEGKGDKDKVILRVGTPGLSGDFVAGFGSSAYDVYVRDLIHGYGTVVETETGEFVWDTEAVLVDEPTASTDDDGNKTYTFELQRDLVWNNGEKITAEDFVLSILLRSSVDWLTIATSANAGIYLQGYEAFRYGPEDAEKYETSLDQKFKGVRLLGTYKFSLTIDAENLPYFYESTMVASSPIDVETYLPGFAVKDSKDGAYITKAGSEKTIAATIAESVNDVSKGQRYNPTVTCGPYQFVRATVGGGAIVEINPKFKTTFDGKKPTIDEIHILKINQETDVDQVIAGTVDIVSGVIEGDKIEAAKADPRVTAKSYMRNGYGLLSMATYFGPTQYPEVRRAVGYLFDRSVFLNEFLGGYGSLVNGPYGEAQWFYKETKAELDAALTNYQLDETKANTELDKSPYKFESDGVTPFDPDKATADNGYYRYNADGEVLQINHMGTTENQVTVLIGLQLQANFWKAGIKFTSVEAEWEALLDNYYYGYGLPEAPAGQAPVAGTHRYYHMFNLATNFYSNYDPFNSWHSSYAGTTNNPVALRDDTLDEIMENMRKLDATQKEEFKEYFVEFVTRWNELLPNLPLYSNEYFDVINNKFTGLNSGPVWSWAKDICDIKAAE